MPFATSKFSANQIARCPFPGFEFKKNFVWNKVWYCLFSIQKIAHFRRAWLKSPRAFQRGTIPCYLRTAPPGYPEIARISRAKREKFLRRQMRDAPKRNRWGNRKNKRFPMDLHVQNACAWPIDLVSAKIMHMHASKFRVLRFALL